MLTSPPKDIHDRLEKRLLEDLKRAERSGKGPRRYPGHDRWKYTPRFRDCLIFLCEAPETEEIINLTEKLVIGTSDDFRTTIERLRDQQDQHEYDEITETTSTII
jgi:hypothetical protein